MNLLVIADNFTAGGFETNLFTQYSILKDKCSFIFAFGNYDTGLNFDDCKIYTGFNFKYSVTINEFYQDVNKLVKIINENNIDVILTHPFHCFFPAVIASQITEKPLTYTYHGFSSYSFVAPNLEMLFFNHFLENCVNIIFCNSKTGEYYLKNYNNLNNVIFLPNSIDLGLYSTHNVISNKNWALISRLDDDKYPEIMQILKNIHKININKLDIYGNGNCYTKIENYIKDNNLNNKVKLMGFCFNIYETINNKYNGIIGIGRVVMEGLAMGYPVLIIGQNKISGIIDNNNFLKIKDYNFVNRVLPNVSIEKLNQQLSLVYKKPNNYNFSKKIEKEYSSKKVFGEVYEYVKHLEFNKSLGITKFYDSLEQYINNDVVASEYFYESYMIYKIFEQDISSWILTANVKTIFLVFNNYYKLIEKCNNLQNLENKINEWEINLKEKIERNEKEINDLNAKIKGNEKEINDLFQKIVLLEKQQQSIIKKIFFKFFKKQ